MTRIVLTASFRGGTGKSTITSNIASIMAKSGQKSIIIDTDVNSPGIHNLFGLTGKNFSETFTDFLFAKTSIGDVTYDISKTIGAKQGSLLLVPASMQIQDIARTLNPKRNHNMLRKALEDLIEEFKPAYIFIDTHPGVNEEVLLAAAFADIVLAIVRPDNQDYAGIGISSQLIQKLGGKTKVIINKVHRKVKGNTLRNTLEKKFKVQVAGVLPFDEEILFAESQYIFSIKNPEHKFSQGLSYLVRNIFDAKPKQRIEILYDLLTFVKNRKPNEIQLLKHSKLDKKSFNDYLKALSQQKFLMKNGHSFLITKKGIEYLREYKTMLNMIDSFGL